MLQFKRLIIMGFLLSLCSCGGGGGDNKPSNTPVGPTSSTSNSSSVTSSTSSVSVLSAPQNLKAVANNASVTLSWNSVVGASSYHIFYATEPNILSKNISAFQNGTWVKNVISPYTITGLENNKTYYFVITAVNTSTESAQSLEVSATPSATITTQEPTAQEVLVVELINRARFDPTAEAMRYGISLNDGITGTPITPEQKQPLAFNVLLTDAARFHSQWMLDADIFSHTGANNSTPGDRILAAGYSLTGSWTYGENIAWGGTTGPSINLTNYAITHHQGLFKSPGHRVNILGESFREVGVGQKQGYFLYSDDGVNYLSSMLSEEFAKSGNNYFLTGVIYSDTNNNQFYDPGEGLDGVSITINGNTYPAYSTGAYSIPLSNGSYDVQVNGTPFTSVVNYTVHINGANIKMDVIKNGTTVNVVSW